MQSCLFNSLVIIVVAIMMIVAIKNEFLLSYSKSKVFRRNRSCGTQRNLNLQAIRLRARDTEMISVIQSVLLERISKLNRFAETQGVTSCSTTDYIYIGEKWFGQQNNFFIEVVHGLWYAQSRNKTLVIPALYASHFNGFDVDSLTKLFCLVIDKDGTIKRDMAVNREEMLLVDLFFLKDAMQRLNYGNISTPILTSRLYSTEKEVAAYFARFYAALWGNTLPGIVNDLAWFLSEGIVGDNKLEYTVIHKRDLEGQCVKCLGTYPIAEESVDPGWNTSIFCTTPIDFLLKTQIRNGKANQPVVVLTDSQTDCLQLEEIGAVFTTGLHLDYDSSYLDRMLGMHADFFIRNPYSSFSWSIFIVREILQLETVPRMVNFDLYYKTPPTWLTTESIREVVEEIWAADISH